MCVCVRVYAGSKDHVRVRVGSDRHAWVRLIRNRERQRLRGRHDNQRDVESVDVLLMIR